AEFGSQVIDENGELDRRALREIVFSDADARRRLEAILHPLIAAAARCRIADSNSPYVLLVVPLLVESGLFEEADRVLVVDVPEQLQINRVVARDGVDRAQAEATLTAQA
ncbi:MAG: dephospho-CoA kinase, partial [Wenzhouxiangellaceae bacterium]